MKQLLLCILFPATLLSQGYTSYFTGNPTNVTTPTEFGICMMGGATEHDNAMAWLLQKAGGGDVVVLRSSGSNGYNNYLYSELGVAVNSVETLVITSVAGATNPYVLDKVAHAEMIWFAGGDQYNYVSYFKDNALEDLINAHVNVKNAPIGGTSAGMAILGHHYFSAQNGSVTSAEALADPYNPYMTLGSNDFVQLPRLQNVITDSHYDDPDRRARHTTFIGRLKHDGFGDTYGIAANEYVAVCIDDSGRAHVYGDYPNYQEFAYFIQPNCTIESTPETCVAGSAFTWNQNGSAVKAYKVPGTMDGTHYFDLNDWRAGAGSGGSWQDWSVNNGVFAATAGAAPDCLLSAETFAQDPIAVYPNPFGDFIRIDGYANAVRLYDAMGKLVLERTDVNGDLATSALVKGLYFLRYDAQGSIHTQKMLKN